MKVMKGIYIEFNEVDEKNLKYNPPELDSQLSMDLD